MDYARELAAAQAAADAAGRAIMDLYERTDAIADAPASITTAADREAQEIILQRLHREFPGDAFRAEEATPTLAALPRLGDRLWIIDPIDGTRGFARKNGEFSVMIAFVHGGELSVGVVFEPVLNLWTYATRGGGCWRRDAGGSPVAVNVTTRSDLSDCTLIQSHSNPARGTTIPVRKLRPRSVIETYSAGVKLARVARGDADVYISTYDTMNDWDLAAGHVLIEEAGGRVSNLCGDPIRYGGERPGHVGGLLASNGALHEAAIAAMSAN